MTIIIFKYCLLAGFILTACGFSAALISSIYERDKVFKMALITGLVGGIIFSASFLVPIFL